MVLGDNDWFFSELLDAEKRQKRGSRGRAYTATHRETGKKIDYLPALLKTTVELTKPLGIRPFEVFVRDVLPTEYPIYRSKEEKKDSLWSLRIDISSGDPSLMTNTLASGAITFSLSYKVAVANSKSLSQKASQGFFLSPNQAQELTFDLVKFLRSTIPKAYGPFSGTSFKFYKFRNISTSDSMYAAIAPNRARREKAFLLFWNSCCAE